MQCMSTVSAEFLLHSIWLHPIRVEDICVYSIKIDFYDSLHSCRNNCAHIFDIAIIPLPARNGVERLHQNGARASNWLLRCRTAEIPSSFSFVRLFKSLTRWCLSTRVDVRFPVKWQTAAPDAWCPDIQRHPQSFYWEISPNRPDISMTTASLTARAIKCFARKWYFEQRSRFRYLHGRECLSHGAGPTRCSNESIIPFFGLKKAINHGQHVSHSNATLRVLGRCWCICWMPYARRTQESYECTDYDWSIHWNDWLSKTGFSGNRMRCAILFHNVRKKLNFRPKMGWCVHDDVSAPPYSERTACHAASRPNRIYSFSFSQKKRIALTVSRLSH